MANNKMPEMVSNYSSLEACIPQETVIKNVRLAAAYVPYQKMCVLLSPVQALSLGTAFPELYSPYEPKNKKAKPVDKR